MKTLIQLFIALSILSTFNLHFHNRQRPCNGIHLQRQGPRQRQSRQWKFMIFVLRFAMRERMEIF